MPDLRKKTKEEDNTSPNNKIPASRFKFVSVEKSPVLSMVQRICLVIALVFMLATVAYLDRAGYTDNVHPGETIGFLDALYYSTVSITTTGYGDIYPNSTSARMINTLIFTPVRVLFVILLIGTTVEILTTKTKFLYRLKRWQSDLSNHVVICGFGVKGQGALEYMRESGQ